MQTLDHSEAADYLCEVMSEDDWYKRQELFCHASARDATHPDVPLRIEDEAGSAPTREVRLVSVQMQPTQPPPSKTYAQVDGSLQPLSVRRGQLISGIVWYVGKRTDFQVQPIILVHNLKVTVAKAVSGMATRVLMTFMPECHEPGMFSVEDALESLSGPGLLVSFVQLPEHMVLDMFCQLTDDDYGKRAQEPVSYVLPPQMMMAQSCGGFSPRLAAARP